MSMVPFFEKKLGESLRWYKYFDSIYRGPHRYTCIVTQVDEEICGIQCSVTMQYITPSGYPTGDPLRLGSHWGKIGDSLEETLENVVRAIPGHPMG